MNNLSNYAEKKIMDHIFKVLSFTQPANIFVSFHTANPGEDGSGAECSGNAYARTQCNIWNAAASRSAANTEIITFPQATGAWGTVTHYGIWDAATDGNMLAYGALSESKVIVSGNIPTIAAGGISISVSTGAISNYLANKMLDHMLKTAEYMVPTNLFVGFSTANPGDNSAGLAEPSAGNNYSRTQCNIWNAATATTGQVANTDAVVGPAASGSWGAITHVAIFDAATAGNLLWYGTITPSQSVGTNDWLEYPAGQLIANLD